MLTSLSIEIEVRHDRCGEYWRMYDRLVKKNNELVEVRRSSKGSEAEVRTAMELILAEMNRHFQCCEKCQAWWRSFEISL